MSEFTITNEENGQRLDKFLKDKLPDVTRSQIQKQIKSGSVLVNEEKTSVHHFLKKGDTITILPKRSFILQAQASVPARVGTKMPGLEIVKDNKNFLIINKPAGLIVHQAPGQHDKTLVDLVLAKYPSIAKIGEDPMRPGIVHRLDKEVSGLLVVAKTQDMFDHLKKQFKTRQVKKEYIALVYGTPQKPIDEINFNIDRSETADYKMAAVPAHESRGRKASTEFELIERLGNYSLLKIKPRTGRAHQIRVHLNAYGLPIVGDLVYRPKKLKTKIKMHRIFLHAQYLGFFDLSKTWQEFTLPLPNELQAILQDIRKG